MDAHSRFSCGRLLFQKAPSPKGGRGKVIWWCGEGCGKASVAAVSEMEAVKLSSNDFTFQSGARLHFSRRNLHN